MILDKLSSTYQQRSVSTSTNPHDEYKSFLITTARNGRSERDSLELEQVL
jgi:hypothetical protein